MKRNIKEENAIIKNAKQKLTKEFVLRANNYGNNYDMYIQHFRDVQCGLHLGDYDITKEINEYLENVCYTYYCPESDKLMYKIKEKFVNAMLSHSRKLYDITDQIVNKIYEEGQTPAWKTLRVLGQRLQEEFNVVIK